MTKRYDCTAGGYQFCSGCYQMEESELGDYVSYEDYALLVAAMERYLPFIPTSTATKTGAARFAENVLAADQYREALEAAKS